MHDESTDGLMMAAARRALLNYEGDCGDREDFWRSLGGDREDALQMALVRAWAAFEGDDGSTPQILHLVAHARYGVLDYVRELGEDREKRRPARAFQRGSREPEVLRDIDGEPILDPNGYTIPVSERPFAKHEVRSDEVPDEEVSGAEVRKEADIRALRGFLDAALMGALEDRERRVIRLLFGLDGPPWQVKDVASAMGLTPLSVARIRDAALLRLRAEMRASEIVGL